MPPSECSSLPEVLGQKTDDPKIDILTCSRYDTLRNNCVGCANFVMILRNILTRYCVKVLQSDILNGATCIIKIFNVLCLTDKRRASY